MRIGAGEDSTGRIGFVNRLAAAVTTNGSFREGRPLRWYLWLVGSCLVGSTLFSGCAWNRQESVSDEPGPSASAANSPLNDSKYQDLINQFSGDGDSYEKQVRGLEEESWTDAFKKAGDKVKGALTLKPKVTPATDPISLASGIPPLGADVYYQAGQLAEERNRPDEALRQYSKALEKNPKYLPALVASARLLDRLGKPDEAMQVYRAAISLHPGKAAPYNDLGLSLARRRQWKAAAAAMRKATELAPKSARYRNNLAMALVRSGDVDGALKELLEAHDPAAAHYNLAYLLKDAGQVATATSHLQRAVKLDPSLKAAETLLAKLQSSPQRPPTQVARRPEAALVVGPQRTSLQQASSQRTSSAQSAQGAPARSASLRMPSSFAAPVTQASAQPASDGESAPPKRLPTVK